LLTLLTAIVMVLVACGDARVPTAPQQPTHRVRAMGFEVMDCSALWRLIPDAK